MRRGSSGPVSRWRRHRLPPPGCTAAADTTTPSCVSRPNNHAALDAILRATQPAARRGYDAEALYHRRLAREAELATGPERDMLLRRARAAMRLESAAVRAAHAISCVSDDEAAWIRSVAGDRPVHVVGMVGRLPAVVPGYGGRRDIIFYGGFMAGPSGPNSDAVRFAVEEIMPRIWDALPDVRLRVIGADPTPEVLALAGPRVDVVGFVSDPAEHLMAARLHLAPIRFGAGVKLRLVESMAAGLPMVTTPNGAEGLGLGPERSRLVGETPSELATMAIDLLTNEPAWDAAQVAVRDVVRRRFGPAPFRNELRALLADLTLTQNATRPGGSWPS